MRDNKTEENQRVLAELTEMIRTGNLVHKGLINVPINERRQGIETAMFGNKIAVLIGDYLLVTANGMLARLKNQDISYIISTALRDLSEGEFYGERDEQNMPMPSTPSVDTNVKDSFDITSDTLPIDTSNTLGYPVREWTVRAMFSGASLLGRGCQGAMVLGHQTLDVQENAYLFGCHLCLAWQAANELQRLTSDDKDAFSLVTAPVLFAISEDRNLYNEILQTKNDSSKIDYVDLKSKILKTDALEKTRLLYELHAKKSLYYVEMFGCNESIDTIKRLINTI